MTIKVVGESAAVWLGLMASSTWLGLHTAFFAGATVSLVTGLWFQRLYFVGHEAVHGKLLPDHRSWNDRLGQMCLAPLLIPLGVYRKIHFFHHAHNRRNHATSALDTFRVSPRLGRLQRPVCAIVWYWSAFGGGFFLQSLVSVLFFALVPRRFGEHVTPAYKGWTARDRSRTQLTLGAFFLAHALIWRLFGEDVWLLWCGIPLAAFGWVYSLTNYIFHYRTSYGADTRRNSRSLRTGALVRWWLLEFNFHEAHHHEPQLPWYALEKAQALEEGAQSFLAGVLQQLRGPVFVPPTNGKETA